MSGNSAGSNRYLGKGGGGIYNSGGATIIDGMLSGNKVSVAYDDCYSIARGGGVDNIGALTISSSTLTGNSAISTDTDYCGYPSYGGGISNLGGGLTINNGTLNGNFASGRDGGSGGGVYISGGTLTINNSTFNDNYSVYSGGGIAGAATLQNTIVANSPYGGNCSGTMTSKGYVWFREDLGCTGTTHEGNARHSG